MITDLIPYRSKRLSYYGILNYGYSVKLTEVGRGKRWKAGIRKVGKYLEFRSGYFK